MAKTSKTLLKKARALKGFIDSFQPSEGPLMPVIRIDGGGEPLDPDKVAIFFDDVRDVWVAIRGDWKTIDLPGIEWNCDGNAIDAAAEAFGVDPKKVLVDETLIP